MHGPERAGASSASTSPGTCFIFHQAALGDFVLIFPILRRLSGPVHVVAPWSKAKLAQRLFGHVTAHNIERPLRDIAGLADATTIISFISSGDDDWACQVRELAPCASIEFMRPHPPFDDRAPILSAPVFNPAGPIVVHPGSGGRDKCWPLDRYALLVGQLPGEVKVICGEVEGDLQEALGAKLCQTLDELVDILETARLYIGNDSGPTHLAGAMGVPTIALFGPTDPKQWAPVGPAVTVLSPRQPSEMTWLDVQTVLEEVKGLGGKGLRQTQSD